jgi:hypothetical protein
MPEPPINVDRLLQETFVARVECHQTLGSTNDRARQCAAEGGPLPLLVLAENQTSGRGRGSNRWWTGPGSLAFSLLLDAADLRIERSRSPLVALAAAVAVAETVAHRLPDRQVGIHWPNDVFADNRKLAGILVETLSPPALRDWRRHQHQQHACRRARGVASPGHHASGIDRPDTRSNRRADRRGSEFGSALAAPGRVAREGRRPGRRTLPSARTPISIGYRPRANRGPLRRHRPRRRPAVGYPPTADGYAAPELFARTRRSGDWWDKVARLTLSHPEELGKRGCSQRTSGPTRPGSDFRPRRSPPPGPRPPAPTPPLKFAWLDSRSIRKRLAVFAAWLDSQKLLWDKSRPALG